MNRHGLFIKLMRKTITSKLLLLLERWFSLRVTCVKWCNVWSSWYALTCSIRQGVLSPCLFAIYVNDLVKSVQSCGYDCYIKHVCVSILLYADNILLLASSVSALQLLLLSACERELQWMDMRINVKNRLVYNVK